MDEAAESRTIYLLRHAKSSWRDGSLSDFDRPLNKRGLRARDTMAQHMRNRGYRPDVIICSPARRATMTFEAIRPVVGDACAVDFDEGLYMGDPKALAHRIERVDDGARSVMLIGHNPGMHMLALALAEPSSTPAFNGLQFKFPTAALCVLRAQRRSWNALEAKSHQLVEFALPRELAAA